ncbi:glycosyltransferase family 4 protein [Flavobacterium suncheonense]|uniref:glycosyltransferase family 4 protein n=1 Tax=Flavobacterium suncheonense TaxID=350894 RepID=UPI003FA3C1FC
MKIAFLTPEYPHEITGNSGGLGTSIKNLAKAMIAQGNSVSVLVYGQKKDAVFYDEAIKIHQIKNEKVKGLSWYLTRKKIEKLINHLYASGEIEIVEAPDWTGITSFITPKKCPVVIKLHGSDTYFCHLDNRPVKWWNRFHEKRALQNANGHISVSAYTAGMTNRLFKLSIPFQIIPNGIDPLQFQAKSSEESGTPVVLYFGTLIRKKGLLELPHIFNKVNEQFPDATLHLVGRDTADVITGSASTWNMMQQLFSVSAKEKVTYLGSVPYAEVREKINKATVCVFPTFAEALPVTWLEAMAMGKAIVASNIGWGTEVITDGVQGYLSYPKHHEEYAEKIVALLKNEALRNQFGAEAKTTVENHFHIATIAQRNIEYYKAVLTKS